MRHAASLSDKAGQDDIKGTEGEKAQFTMQSSQQRNQGLVMDEGERGVWSSERCVCARVCACVCVCVSVSNVSGPESYSL